MKVINAARPGTCLLRAEASACNLNVEGLTTEELRSFFSLGPTRVIEARDVRVDLDGDSITELAQTSGETQVQAQPYGQGQLQSGHGAVLKLSHSNASDRLIPQALHLALCQQWARAGLMPLHACAFELNGTGVLALGEQGAGKSVLAMSALATGGRLVSDDWILLGNNTENRLCAERLREFVMLRPGAVLEKMKTRLPELNRRSAVPHGRLSCPIPASDPRFPVSCRVDQVWSLRSPGGKRPAMTKHSGIDQARLYGQLIESAMPLLFGSRFPVERQALSKMLNRLLTGTVIRQIDTGLDLIEHTEQTLETLIKA